MVAVSRRGARIVLALAVVGLSATQAHAAATWTGVGGVSWATPGSWQGSVVPTAIDTVIFNDTGTTGVPNDLTSLLNASRTIGGLTFNNTAGKYHTLDFNASTLTIGGNLNFNSDQPSTTTTTLRNGALAFSGSFANLHVARGVSTAANATADLSGLTSVNAVLQELTVGNSNTGSASGTLKLAPVNTLTATRILVGVANGTADAQGTMTLGQVNTLHASEFSIASNYANGVVTIAPGGSLVLGSPMGRTKLQIANQATNTNSGYQGRMDLTGAAVTAHLSDLIVGQRGGLGANGSAAGTLLAGTGTYDIGLPGNASVFYVGRSVTGSPVSGLADFSAVGTLTASVNALAVGHAVSGSATGQLLLAGKNTLSTNTITVGGGTNANGTLTLGFANTITANQISIGEDYGNGAVLAPASSTVTIGNPMQRARISIAVQNTNTNGSYFGRLDLTGAAATTYANDVLVAVRGGPGAAGAAVGTFHGGSSGSIDIGAPGNTSNLVVARSTTGSPAIGTADFSGLSSLVANVNLLQVATATNGSTQGILRLAHTSTVTANSITVGAGSGDSSGSLTLGMNTTLLTNQLTIAQDYSHGNVTLPAGGTLTLGSPTQRVHLTMATGVTNTGQNFLGHLNLSNGRATAYFGTVVIGDKNDMPGGETGTLSIGPNPANYVIADTIALGGLRSSGTVVFGGGRFFAGTVTGGAGTANFNWTGGTLSVGQFGSPARLFSLDNASGGTLAPEKADGSIGVTSIYGNYRQQVKGAMALRIAGNSPGTGNDQVHVSGTATLSGDLRLSVLNGFTPGTGENYLLMTYGVKSGQFSFVAPPQMPAGVAFTLDDQTVPTELWLRTVAPVVQTWTGSAGNGVFNTAGNWNAPAAPGTASTLLIGNSTGAARNVSVAASTTVHRVELSGSGPASPVTLSVPAGIRLGVASALVVGEHATLTGAGELVGHVVVAPGGLLRAMSAASPLVLAGTTASTGTVAAEGGTLAINGPATLGGAIQVRGGTINLNAPGIVLTSPVEFAYSGVLNFNAPGTQAAQVLLAFNPALLASGSVNVAAGASVTSDGVDATAWTVNGTHTIRPNGGATGASQVRTLTLGGSMSNWTGRLDLTNNALIVQTNGGVSKSTAIAALQNQIDAGKQAGAPGITSSTANDADGPVVLADNADLNLATYRGRSVNADSLILVQARFGDATIDGKVDAFDLNRLAANWQATDKLWSGGDFTGDGKVDAFDLNTLAAHWQAGTSLEAALAAYPQFAGVTVPEPASLGVLAGGLGTLLRRRKK